MTDKPKYGRDIKKVIFEETDKRHADLKIKLYYNELTQAQFFKGVESALLDDSPHALALVEEIKKQNNASKTKRTKVSKSNKKADETIRQFALNDKEVESIFDILEKEHPEL